MTARRLAVTTLLMLVMSVATASPAAAHAALLFSTPTADSAIPSSPTRLSLVYSEPVSVTATAVALTGEDGRPAQTGAPDLSSQNRVVTVAVQEVLNPGTYSVHWTVTALDGDLVEGSFRFGVGDLVSSSGSGQPSSTTWERTASTTVLRWILFAGFALALGGLAGEQFVSRNIDVRTRAWVTPGALAVAGSAIVLAALVVSQTGIDQLASAAGWVLIAEAVGGASAAALAATRWRSWAVLPLTVVVVAEAYRSHVHEASGLGGAALTAVHLSAAALWIGALVYVLQQAWPLRHQSRLVRQLLTGYAQLALFAFLVVVATGTVSALLLVDLGDVLATGYGVVLVTKAALVAVVAALALTARIWLRTGPARTALRPARAEMLTLVGVLGATALLVSLAPPSSADKALPFPPPASGVTVPVGTRTGQVGVAVRASEGQIVVQLTAPGADQQQPGAPTPESPDYGLSGVLALPRQSAGPLSFHACGVGCFVAPTTWMAGSARLTLDVSATGWTGGTVSLLVPWPGHANPTLLTRVTEVMTNVPSVAVHETVTSDSSRPVPYPVNRIVIPGEEFIATEPYASGKAPITTVVDRGPDHARLLLGFPSDQYTVDLVVDGNGRIQRETLTTTNHVITRVFTYPRSQS